MNDFLTYLRSTHVVVCSTMTYNEKDTHLRFYIGHLYRKTTFSNTTIPIELFFYTNSSIEKQRIRAYMGYTKRQMTVFIAISLYSPRDKNLEPNYFEKQAF